MGIRINTKLHRKKVPEQYSKYLITGTHVCISNSIHANYKITLAYILKGFISLELIVGLTLQILRLLAAFSE